MLAYHFFIKVVGVILFAVEMGWFVARPFPGLEDPRRGDPRQPPRTPHLRLVRRAGAAGNRAVERRCAMKTLSVLALLAFRAPAAALATDKPAPPPAMSDESWAAAKSAELEVMPARLGANPAINASATLIEVEDLLRRFRTAPAAQKSSLRSQVDASAARLELELAGIR